MIYQLRFCWKLFAGNLENAILNPELVLKLPNILIVIGSLRFHFKVVVRVAFKNENFLEFK